MKKLLVILVGFLVPLTVNASDTANDLFCKDMSEYASLFMEARQSNMPLEMLLVTLDRLDLSEGYYDLAKIAYRADVKERIPEKSETISDFKAAILYICLEQD